MYLKCLNLEVTRPKKIMQMNNTINAPKLILIVNKPPIISVTNVKRQVNSSLSSSSAGEGASGDSYFGIRILTGSSKQIYTTCKYHQPTLPNRMHTQPYTRKAHIELRRLMLLHINTYPLLTVPLCI